MGSKDLNPELLLLKKMKTKGGDSLTSSSENLQILRTENPFNVGVNRFI